MCRNASGIALAMATLVSCAAGLRAQTALDWRHIGNASLDLGLASLATGPVDRVWFSDDGAKLYARTHAGQTFVTDDLEQWRSVQAAAPPADDAIAVPTRPEPAAKVRAAAGSPRIYGFGMAAYRSEDSGVTWSNLTVYRGSAMLGGPIADLAVSPRNEDEIVVANGAGVWHSVDGGLSWTGLNDGLSNLPVRRILALPAGTRGVRIALDEAASRELEWAPGEKTAWRTTGNLDLLREEAQKKAVAQTIGAAIGAVGSAGTYLYAGGVDGQLWVSQDRGATWVASSDRLAGPVEAIFVSPRDPRVALAAVGARSAASATAVKTAHVFRTMNGGIFWDDLTANLPDAAVHGITADAASGAIYAATDAGLFVTQTDLGSAGRATNWSLAAGLPSSPVMDVKLDSAANQLFAAVEGQGVFVTIAPHRIGDIRVVSAGDLIARGASPGGLLSVLGAQLRSAQISDSAVPVLSATETASQIQIPFDMKGSGILLSLDGGARGKMSVGLPLQNVSPAIFADPDGSPLILDADSGVLLDSSKPARAGSRIQILATGLGRVKPDWLAGVPAPLKDPPRVEASVRVYLDHTPIEVVQAALAPGYIGLYLIEAELPALVNSGPAELYLEAEGQASNRVRLYLSQ